MSLSLFISSKVAELQKRSHNLFRCYLLLHQVIEDLVASSQKLAPFRALQDVLPFKVQNLSCGSVVSTGKKINLKPTETIRAGTDSDKEKL